MSGGHFDYDQYKIGYIADSIKSIIDKNNKPIEKEDRWGDFDDRTVYHSFSDETIAEFEKAIKCLKMAEIYAQRIDWLISGDDNENTFHKRLKEEINKL